MLKPCSNGELKAVQNFTVTCGAEGWKVENNGIDYANCSNGCVESLKPSYGPDLVACYTPFQTQLLAIQNFKAVCDVNGQWIRVVDGIINYSSCPQNCNSSNIPSKNRSCSEVNSDLIGTIYDYYSVSCSANGSWSQVPNVGAGNYVCSCRDSAKTYNQSTHSCTVPQQPLVAPTIISRNPLVITEGSTEISEFKWLAVTGATYYISVFERENVERNLGNSLTYSRALGNLTVTNFKVKACNTNNECSPFSYVGISYLPATKKTITFTAPSLALIQNLDTNLSFNFTKTCPGCDLTKTPTGTLTVYLNSTVFYTYSNWSYSATSYIATNIQLKTAGSFDLYFTYSGDTNYNASTSSHTTFTVAAPPVTLDPCLASQDPPIGTVCSGGAIYIGSLSPGATSGFGIDKYMTTPGGCGPTSVPGLIPYGITQNNGQGLTYRNVNAVLL